MAQRKFIKQLPVINQTTTLQKFFNATIDQVFQPGELTNVNAYIGRKPSYYNPTTDFYKPEYDTERSFYQLEPAMVSDDTNGNEQDLLFYIDLTNKLRFQGALVNNHNRLFETDYYSWCPPINIDKLENYRNYYWLPNGPPIMTMTIPVNTYTGDGTKVAFPAPAALANSIVDVKVVVAGIPNTNFTYANDIVTFTTAPSLGAVIQIWTNGNFVQNINGQQTYAYPEPVTAYAVEDQTISSISNGKLIIRDQQFVYPEITLDPAPALLRGMRVEVIDDTWNHNWDVAAWDTNSWDTGLAYVVEMTEANDVMVIDLQYQSGKVIAKSQPQYWTIERDAIDENPWSLSNHWYNTNLVIYSAPNYLPANSTRPIIEFDNNLKLFNYGVRRQANVDVVYDTSTSTWALFNATTENKTSGNVVVGSSANTVSIGTYALVAGQRVLVLNSTDTSIANKIYVVGVDANNNITLTADVAATLYDMVAVVDLSYVEPNPDIPIEYFFNGTTWAKAQEYSNAAPLFDLFDNNGVSFGNSSSYLNSSFAGSQIFSYSIDTTGTNAVDSVLNIAPVFNTYGSFEFTNNLNTDVITSTAGTYTGLKYFTNMTLDSNNNVVVNYETNWRYAGQTTQAIDPTTGFYEIPQNLQANPNNDDITTISRNDWFPQFQQILAANNWLYPSQSRVLTTGTNIVQNRGTLLKSMLLGANTNLDVMKTFLYVSREYARYRAKLVQYLTTMYTSGTISTVAASLATALNYLKITKTSSFSFFNNGMGGANYFIPASGAYLGITPLWTPEYLLQVSGANTYLLLRGHDGSILPGFTVVASTNVQITATGLLVDGVATSIDVRDQIMFAYEQQLYSACDSSLQNTRRPQFDVMAHTPGKFRTTDYSVTEYTQVATPIFERWAAQGQKDFRTNKNFDENNVWTWNFSSVLDIDGQAIPGHWRGIYRYYFDTVRPDTHPWEMLGFTTKPATWDANYSWTIPAQRDALVAAITAGNVGTPSAPVLDPTFARANFSKYIPVDANGVLLDPIAAGIVVNLGNEELFANNWVFGDCAPVEYTWLTSEYTSFILSEMGYLLKPVRFVETNWEPLDNITVFPTQSDQIISKSLGRRKHFTEYTVHNEVVNKASLKVIGLQQWISDYVTSQGQDITTTFGDHVRGLGVQLGYKVGAFTDSKTMIASTESQGVLPSENVNVVLYNSPSISEEFYSGVIVKWTGNGWSVLGYDVLNPVFNILPPNTTGPKVTIALGSMPTPSNPWRPNTYYQTGVLIAYENAVYQCLKTHTSGSAFEQQYWSLQAGLSTAIPPSLLFYTKAQVNATVQTVPYGTVFYKPQDVANFLAGYELYLQSAGWVFDSFNSDNNANNDFRVAVRQFLNWAQVSWAPGTFISLSPLADGVKFKTAHGAIQPIEQIINGVYSILDKTGAAVDIKATKVNRLNGEITVSATNSGIYGLRLSIAEVEHCLIFDNITKFNDVIYEPLFNLRQNRIRMNFNISTSWTGTLNAPGFLITDNLMTPSFDRTVEDVRNMYSIEQPVYSVMRDYARHQIGYQSQSFLDNIFDSELNQFEFYQGMIQQKGTPGALDKLLRNTVLTASTNLEFLEEWAFRVSNYGSVMQENVFEFLLTSDDIRQEPQRIDVVDVTDETLDASALTALQNVDSLTMTLYSNDNNNDSRWVMPPGNTASGEPIVALFPEKSDYRIHDNDLPTAGYVRTTEVEVTASSFDSLNTRIQAGTVTIEDTSRVWVYDKGDHLVSKTYVDNTGTLQTTNVTISCNDWDVLRAMPASTETLPNTIVQIVGGSVGLDITLFYPTNIVAGEYIYLASPVGTDPDIAGVYRAIAVNGDVVTIEAAVNVSVAYVPTTDTNGNLVANTGAPIVLRLVSLRFYENNSSTFATVFGVNPSYAYLGSIPVFTNTDIYQSVLPTAGGSLPKELTAYWSLLNDGELVYVDLGFLKSTQNQYPAHAKRWIVCEWSASEQQFNVFRTQAPRIYRDRIDSIALYDSVTALDNTSNLMQANPLLYQDIVSFDPVQSLIPGAAMREVAYKQEYDPARYNQGAETALGLEWDASQVGRIWWNLRTCRFLLSETNDLSKAGDDYATEMQYRQANWGSVAPDCAVELYEWTESDISPVDWHTNFVAGSDPTTYDGDIYNATTPSWVESQVYDNDSGTFVTKYYFWVKNRQTTPAVAFRTISAASAAAIIVDPASNGISWIAPIAANSLIVKAVSQYLTPTSAIQIRVRKNDAKVGKHSEWQLLRPNDPLSLPSAELFTSMVTSMVARDPLGNPVPNPKLYATAQVGDSLRDGQSWFINSTNARKHIVQYLNNYFASLLLSDERPYALTALTAVEHNQQYLQWTQTLGSAYIEPIPNEYQGQIRYGTLQELANANVPSGVVANFGTDTPFWSVMQTTKDSNNPFAVSTRWDQQVSSLTALSALTGLTVGTRILVTANASTANFWTVWEWNGTTFVIAETQRYDTSSIFTVVDWYATGYDSTMVPSLVFNSQTDRDLALGANPTVGYVLVNNDGQGRWMWQSFSNGVWTVVAKENGTIQLNPNVYGNTGPVLDITGTTIGAFDPIAFASMVNNRDMGLELNFFINALRDSVMTALELNNLFFSTVKYAHTEQDFIDWCFKTSFMYIQGFNANLIASPIASIDYTSDLLAYIDEVKPYHVKIRDFISKYGISDTAQVHATDFDKPVYFDASLPGYRVLNPNVPADIVILQTGNYADWYNNWQAGNNQVRKINVTLTFDRVSDDSIQTNGLAMDRLKEYWSGDVTSKPALSKIMKGILFNAATLSGGNYASPPFDVHALTFAPDVNGNFLITNAPSFVYFAQKFDAGSYRLPSDWDNIPYGGGSTAVDTAWDNPNDALDTGSDVWDSLTMTTWDNYLNADWNQLNNTGSQVGIWDAFLFQFNATTPEFDYTSGHRIEIFRNGSRLSLLNQDYIIIQDSNVANLWKIYISMDVMAAGDTVIIMLVAADTPQAILNGGALTTADSAYEAIINGSTLADPYHAADHPEELVDVNVVAGVRIKIHQTWTPGSAQMELTNMNLLESNTATLPIPAQSKQAIALYDNGTRVPQIDVTFDARDSEFTYLGTDVNSVMQAVVWGYGGTTYTAGTEEDNIVGMNYFNGDGTTVSFPITVDSYVLSTDTLIQYVTIDGIQATNFGVTNGVLTFSTAPALNSYIKIVSMRVTNVNSGFNIVEVTELAMSSMGSESLSGALGLTVAPRYIQSIIEVDGLRVMGSGIYEAFITPANPTLELDAVLDINNVTATFNWQPVIFGVDVRQNVIVPGNTRSVNLGANWAASDLIVTQGNSAPMIVSMIVGTAPGYSLGNLNPDHPEPNSLITVGWDEDSWDNVSTWDDPTFYEKYVLSPSNPDSSINLTMYEGRLINMQAYSTDIAVSIVYGDTLPNDLTGFTWTVVSSDPNAQATALMMGNQIEMLSVAGVVPTGDLIVYDASQAQYSDAVAFAPQFPNASRLTVTTFTKPDAFDMRTVTYDHISGDNWFPIPGTYDNVASLWVTLNGRKLIEGTQYYVNAADNGFDIPAWDEDARDRYAEFGPNSMAVRLNEENGVIAVAGDHVVITVFRAPHAKSPETTLTFLDPLRDFGIADRYSVIEDSDCYTLVTAMTQESTNVVITPVLSDATPLVSMFKLDRTIYHPGYMWVGQELIYFVEATFDSTANTITLENVIRGYRGSSIVNHPVNEEVLSVSTAKLVVPKYIIPTVTPAPIEWTDIAPAWDDNDQWTS